MVRDSWNFANNANLITQDGSDRSNVSYYKNTIADAQRLFGRRVPFGYRCSNGRLEKLSRAEEGKTRE